MVENLNIPSVLVLEILKTAVNKNEWKLKPPLWKWATLYKIGQICYRLIKIKSFEEDQTLHWFSYFPLVYLSIYLILLIHTTIFYLRQGELDKMFPTTCLMGAIFGVH